MKPRILCKGFHTEWSTEWLKHLKRSTESRIPSMLIFPLDMVVDWLSLVCQKTE